MIGTWYINSGQHLEMYTTRPTYTFSKAAVEQKLTILYMHKQYMYSVYDKLIFKGCMRGPTISSNALLIDKYFNK